MKFAIGILICSTFIFCSGPSDYEIPENLSRIDKENKVYPGSYNIDSLLFHLSGKRVAVVSNHTGLVEGIHLVDTLLTRGINISVVFAPEHGFRGNRPDGEEIDDHIDRKTGIPIISLYGSNKKPTNEQLKDVEVVLFDIQDVGARFYTYLSTLHYVMQACTEMGISVIVADRPNPNIHYVDGPVLENRFSSFVGLHPVPIVYGMTIGEYAMMINGERWHHQEECDLFVIPCENYNRNTKYNLPVKPSPNLPTMESIFLYPSLCLFEGTTVSVGRGTDAPFTLIGEPGNMLGEYSFTPEPKEGASTNPKHKGKKCNGYDLSDYITEPEKLDRLDLTWVQKMYRESPDPNKFFNANGYFDKLAGTDKFRLALLKGDGIETIRTSWKEEIEEFKTIRAKYLIYKEY